MTSSRRNNVSIDSIDKLCNVLRADYHNMSHSTTSFFYLLIKKSRKTFITDLNIRYFSLDMPIKSIAHPILSQDYNKVYLSSIALHENKDIVYLVKRPTSYDLENGLIYNNGMVKIKITLNITNILFNQTLYIEKDFQLSRSNQLTRINIYNFQIKKIALKSLHIAFSCVLNRHYNVCHSYFKTNYRNFE